jgi:acetyl esterase/lipase
MRGLCVAFAILASLPTPGAAEQRVEKNVVYGMYSGLALLMDVQYPEQSNGCGLVVINGSGWNAPQAYNGFSLKDRALPGTPRLLSAGYTIFVVNHRQAPRFRYPAAVEDVQRAVRFIRYHASDYGIDADRLGAVGYSSGAHLAALLGVLDGVGQATDSDPINRLSARVQTVVAWATPTDLEHFDSGDGVRNVASFMGQLLIGVTPESVEAAAYRAASPITHLSASSAPILLVHGDADTTVPIRQSELMLAAATRLGADVKLIRVPGGGHLFALELAKHPDWPDVLGETARWLDRHLKMARLPG